jgi:hypothetical protein
MFPTATNIGLPQPGPMMAWQTLIYAGAAVNWLGIKVNQFTAARSRRSDPGLRQAVPLCAIGKLQTRVSLICQ